MGRVYPLGPSQQATYPEKQYSTLQARAALQGAVLHRGQDDRGDELFVVTKWQLTRRLHSLEMVSLWLDKLEGKTA
jgi:hypothetical protein